MTPRQIKANLMLAGRRKRMEQANALSLMAIATQSEAKVINENINTLLAER